MAAYCDTNFLVRLYADTPEKDGVLNLLAGQSSRIDRRFPITWLHEIELPNALQQMVLLARSGTGIPFSPEKSGIGLAQFDEDLTDGRRLVAASLSIDELVRQARELSLRHTARHGFRAYDVAHVASALLLKCDTFWSFDIRASKLAKLEGLKTL